MSAEILVPFLDMTLVASETTRTATSDQRQSDDHSLVQHLRSMPPSPPTTPEPDRPYSGFEELDLDDEPLTPNPTITTKQDRTSTSGGISPTTSFTASNPYASPVSQKDDPWRSAHHTSSSAASASRFSASTPGAGATSPPKMERASTSTSRASGSRLGSNDAAVLGVAVVDFNHLVSWLRFLHHVKS